MVEPLVQSIDLGKTFQHKKRGEVKAVDSVSFEAFGGEIFGLLGPNGAGKTTMLRMLATILTPTHGSAKINGHDVAADPDGARRSLGFLSGDTGVYDRLTAREMITYFGQLYGMEQTLLDRRLSEIRSMLDMDEFIDRRCGKLSTGQRQKVSIARTVIHDPPVLILDEPTSGLDVLAARNIVTFIREARDLGKCIILSTHVMGEAERLCDRVGIIHEGSIVAMGSKEELYSTFGETNLEAVFLKAVGVEI